MLRSARSRFSAYGVKRASVDIDFFVAGACETTRGESRRAQETLSTLRGHTYLEGH